MASFKEAFAAARKAGKKEFSWNGNRYNTKLKEEVGAAPKKSLKPVGRGGRPLVDSSGPAKPSGDTIIKPVVGKRAGSQPVAKPTVSAKDAKADRPTPSKPSKPTPAQLAAMTPAQRHQRNAAAARQRRIMKSLD